MSAGEGRLTGLIIGAEIFGSGGSSWRSACWSRRRRRQAGSILARRRRLARCGRLRRRRRLQRHRGWLNRLWLRWLQRLWRRQSLMIGCFRQTGCRLLPASPGAVQKSRAKPHQDFAAEPVDWEQAVNKAVVQPPGWPQETAVSAAALDWQQEMAGLAAAADWLQGNGWVGCCC